MSASVSEQTVRSLADLADSALRHLMVVGGDLRDWERLGDERWTRRVDDLGAVVAMAGGTWLTLRSYEAGSAEAGAEPPVPPTWSRVVRVETPDDGERECTVIVDPRADGRERFAEAMAALDPDLEVNETTVATALYDPADCEPDAVLILGPPTRLPPSLVWELAYAELVFVDIAWHELGVEHVVAAIRDFAGRRRRFGGLDQ